LSRLGERPATVSHDVINYKGTSGKEMTTWCGE